jgi:hypothetical protein
MSPGVAIQVVQGLGALASAWAIKSIIDAEEQKPMTGGFRCATCNGSRKVPCLCTKWSDNDIGCGTCSGTGMMRCSSCGGTGTGKPLPVQIRASNMSGEGGNRRTWILPYCCKNLTYIQNSSPWLFFPSLNSHIYLQLVIMALNPNCSASEIPLSKTSSTW